MSSTILKITNLSKSFGAVKASDNISLEIKKDQIHALIGPNGAGKSTIVKLITGFLAQDSGFIFLNNNDISNFSIEKRAQIGISRSFQVSSTIENFKLIDNIKLSLIGMKKRFFELWSNTNLDQKLTEEALLFLKQVGLDHKSDLIVSSLSHGEKRKLEICIALSMKPKLFLFDEPMAGLDINSSNLMISLFKKLKKKAPILLIEHDMNAVFSLADKITVLDHGRIIASGNVNEIRNNLKVRQVYLGSES